MKSHFYLLLCALFVGLLLWPNQQVTAQTLNDTTNVVIGDTIYVAWMKTGFTPRDNALRNAIAGDTLAGGVRANTNRVYKLKLGGYYWTSDDITNSGFTLRIVADKAGTGQFPPILQMRDTREADGSTAALHLITASNNVTLKNIYISGRTTATRAQSGAYQPVIFGGSNKTYIIDGCIFEQSNFALLAFTGANNNCTIINNKFRNLQETPVTQQYTGRGISIWADQTSVIIENNTFFNLGFVTFQMEGGSAKYLRYNHNTIVSVGRGLMSNSGNWWQKAYFANNLIIDAWWEGERYADTHASGRDPRQAYNGLFNIGPLPSSYGPQQARRYVVTHNYAFLNPAIKAKYGTGGTDSIVSVRFMDPVSKLDYAIPYVVGGANKGHMYVSDTTWLSSLPAGFVNYLSDADWQKPRYSVTGATMADSMWKFITNIYSGITGGTEIFYHPSLGASDQTWPLPENLGYSTSDPLFAAGIDGLPIGDLNYFPAQLAAFEAGKAGFVKLIEDKAGPEISFPIDSTIEAEKATLGGTAVQAAVQGLTYYEQKDGAGSLTWTFNVTDAGLYDTKWYIHMTGRGQSGPVLAINGQSFVDKAFGWGQFVFDPTKGPGSGLSNSAWVWVPIISDSMKATGTSNTNADAIFTLASGSNTIGVMGGGWGVTRYAEIHLVKRGTTDTIKLKAPEAVPVLVTPGAVDVIWVASGFKYVSMGTGGTISANVTAPRTGTYHLRTFYQNTGSTQSVQIKEGSTVLATESFSAKADQTGLDNFSAGFTMTAGAHTIALSGANINVDFVQLVGEVTSVRRISDVPQAYDLKQNYPNPFNPTTTIKFALGKASNVRLTVYNVLGQQVATLINNDHFDAGAYNVEFNASHLASGAYFYRLEAGNFVSSKKMLLLK